MLLLYADCCALDHPGTIDVKSVNWFAIVLAAALVSATAVGVRAQERSFPAWLAEVKAEAISAGIKADVVAAALDGLEPLPVVVERDRSQAETTLTLDRYLARRLDRGTVRTAREMLRRHTKLLSRVSAAYGVPSRVVVAVWGLESNFGRFVGVRPTIAALATLAFDERRATYFRGELLEALRILERGDIAVSDMKGSWAGAMGQVQFMPSSYLKHAVDFDRDGRRDIWRSQADVFASIANYLVAHGWSRGVAWGREVKVRGAAAKIVASEPYRTAGCEAMQQLSEQRPLSEWRRIGVTDVRGKALPKTGPPASLLRSSSRYFLVYPNYESILAYNCAQSYALSVALLSDRLR